MLVGFACGAGFAALALLAAQYSRIRWAWAFLSAAVRFRPLLVPAGAGKVTC